jgi:archaellum biogenesis ATPase FlaH
MESVSTLEEYYDHLQIYDSEISIKTIGMPERKKLVQPFQLISASELTAKPIKIDWLLENIIERGSLNLLFGEPGAGKSLFALEWSFCMAAGIDFYGYRTQQTDVVIVAGEGYAGIGRRLKALEQKYKIPTPNGLFISKQPAQFLDARNAQWVASSIKALCTNPGLVIIDTLHRNMDGDENSSQDIGRFISNLDNYLKPLGAAILVVHHCGHGQKDRSRGSSSIRAAMDGEFSATKSASGITLTCHKAKDFEAFKPLHFTLKRVSLDWLDDQKKPMTSVYLEYTGEAKTSVVKSKLSARDDAILTALSEATKEHGIEPPAEIRGKFAGFEVHLNPDRKIVNIEHWREKAYKAISVDAKPGDDKSEAKKKAFQRARNKLFDHNFTVEYGDFAWRK